MASESDYKRLSDTLCNTSGNVPLASRFRALFSLKGLGSERAIEIIGSGLSLSLSPTNVKAYDVMQHYRTPLLY